MEMVVRFTDPRRENLPLTRGVHMSDRSTLRAGHKRGVVGVDVRGLNINETLRVVRGRSQPLSQQFRNNVNNPGVEAGEPLQFLRIILSTGGIDVP